MGEREGSTILSEIHRGIIAMEESREAIGPRIEVGVLGGTGAVGQRFMDLLYHHPWFKVAEVYASERSKGKSYRDATNWIVSSDVPEELAELEVKTINPGNGSKLIFSAASAPEINKIETDLAKAGHIVISNASAHRMDIDVPLLIPEINPGHLELINLQMINRSQKGFIVTNPNCSTVGLAMVLKPLHDKFGVESVNVVTMQALSGAGYPGVPSLDALGNVIPYIGSEEDKMETEPQKILGIINDGKVDHANFMIEAQCNRVPVRDGHMETVSIKFRNKPDPDEVVSCLSEFRAIPQYLELPSAPQYPIVYRPEPNRPQPILDCNTGKGMSVVVGRVRESKVNHIKMIVLSHNTIRGAAGGALLNAELLRSQGYLK